VARFQAVQSVVFQLSSSQCLIYTKQLECNPSGNSTTFFDYVDMFLEYSLSCSGILEFSSVIQNCSPPDLKAKSNSSVQHH
jgi:hypothetical protein